VTALGVSVSVYRDADAFAASTASLVGPQDADHTEPPAHYAERGWAWPPQMAPQAFISHGVGEVWAVDQEHESVEFGRLKAQRDGIANIRWIARSAQDLDAGLVQSLTGFLLSTSFLSPDALGSAVPDFEADLTAAMLRIAPGGRFIQDVSFAYDLARRPATAGRPAPRG
jgi:hypothetical protein